MDTSTGGDKINRRHTTDMSTLPHGLILSTDDIARIWRINHPPSLLTEPDTMTDQILQGLQLPSHKKNSMPAVVLYVLQGHVNGSWTQTNSNHGGSASGPQAIGASFGAKENQVLKKPYLCG